MVDRAGYGGRRTQHLDADLHTWRRQRMDMLLEGGQDRLPVLIRHEPHAHLRPRLGGDDRFGPFAREAADEAVRVQRRAAARSFECQEARLALQGARPGHAFDRLGVARILRLPRRELLRGRLADRLVEARNRDVSVPALQLADVAGEWVDEVGW